LCNSLFLTAFENTIQPLKDRDLWWMWQHFDVLRNIQQNPDRRGRKDHACTAVTHEWHRKPGYRHQSDVYEGVDDDIDRNRHCHTERDVAAERVRCVL